jgi:serine O-acetyltransferase
MFEIFKQDVERWISLAEGNRHKTASLPVVLKLLYRYMPLRATAWFRLGNWCKGHHIRLLPSMIQRHILRVYGLDIMVGMPVGGGLYIAHPYGVTLCAQQIGRNCSVISASTVGMNKEWRFPIIGDNVFIGAGARVLGGIRIGNDVKIGANAVVLNDAPNGATLVGIPAEVKSIYGERTN